MKHISMEYARKLLQAYAVVCKPLCQEIRMPQTAFDILMFLANNPGYQTARDIVEVRGIKANLVSVNVEKLVQEGLLERRPSVSDRRKTILVCTEKAQPVIEKGRALQESFYEQLFISIDSDERAVLAQIIKTIAENLDKILEGGEAQ